MKLELKHLAPYLPYGLKGIDYDNKTYLFIGLDCNGKEYWDCNEVLDKKGYDVKPILRPLSDLTEEIEINGEKFVPKNKLTEMFDYITFDYRAFESDFFLSMPYDLVKQLFEWHFDVFGLIEQGLAIDINTLK